jgi:hypothetical protein
MEHQMISTSPFNQKLVDTLLNKAKTCMSLYYQYITYLSYHNKYIHFASIIASSPHPIITLPNFFTNDTPIYQQLEQLDLITTQILQKGGQIQQKQPEQTQQNKIVKQELKQEQKQEQSARRSTRLASKPTNKYTYSDPYDSEDYPDDAEYDDDRDSDYDPEEDQDIDNEDIQQEEQDKIFSYFRQYTNKYNIPNNELKKIVSSFNDFYYTYKDSPPSNIQGFVIRSVFYKHNSYYAGNILKDNYTPRDLKNIVNRYIYQYQHAVDMTYVSNNDYFMRDTPLYNYCLTYVADIYIRKLFASHNITFNPSILSNFLTSYNKYRLSINNNPQKGVITLNNFRKPLKQCIREWFNLLPKKIVL